ncbi:MAG: TSUP family transporter [Rhodospirillales bacterium]|jgi:uncharacterized membrane protein YfcA
MALGVFQLGFLFAAAFITAIINAVAAVGGGMVLFAIMLTVLNYAVVIPVHATIQFWSSFTRVWIFRRAINYRLIGIYSITYIPSAALGIYLWKLIVDYSAVQPVIKIIISVYLVMFLFDWTIKIKTTDRTKLMLYAGAWSGVVALTAGSPAPVMAPFFIQAKLNKEEFIGTWALSGITVHISKFPLFFFIWDSLTFDYIWLILLLVVGVVAGTYTGKIFLGGISETLFKKILTSVLLLLATKLFIWDGIRPLIFAS